MSKLPLGAAGTLRWARVLRPVCERAAFVFYLALVVSACGAVGLGLICGLALHDFRTLIGGLGALLLAAMLNWHGYRAWNFRRWEESIEPSDRRQVLEVAGATMLGAEALENLLIELESLDETDAGRDVWRIQALRQEAHVLLDGEPALREEFCARAGAAS